MAQKLKKYVDAKGKSFAYLYFDEVTKIFYVRHREYGKISLETTEAKIAIPKIMNSLSTLEARKRKAIVRTGENILWRDVYSKMYDIKETDDTKESTLTRIDTIWRLHIEPYWGNLEPKTLSQESVDSFKKWHREKFPKQQLVNVFKYLGNMFRVASEYGYIEGHKIPRMDLPKDELKGHATAKGVYIPYTQFLSIVKHMPGKFGLIANLAYYMGMRKMEIGSLECNRVMEDGGRVYLDFSAFDTKTGLPRTIPVPDFLTEELLNLKKANIKYIFAMGRDENRHIPAQTIDRAWRDAKVKAKIKTRIRFHDTRHTRATDMAKAKINPVLAVTYLGMTLKTYQQKYLKLQKEDLLIISEEASKLYSVGSSR